MFDEHCFRRMRKIDEAKALVQQHSAEGSEEGSPEQIDMTEIRRFKRR